jgi:hypothetical protein
MNKQFLLDLRKAIDANLENGELTVKEVAAPLTVEPYQFVGISKDVPIDFDGNGDFSRTVSQYCPVNISFSGYITDLNASFHVHIDTNYPQHFDWDVIEGQTISATIKTKIFGSTSGTITIHSSVPNTQANLHVDCNL